jgi:hypothetical protein
MAQERFGATAMMTQGPTAVRTASSKTTGSSVKAMPNEWAGWCGALFAFALVYACSGDDPIRGLTPSTIGDELASLYENTCRPNGLEDQLPECAGGEFSGPNPDMNCSTASSSTGAACSRDCLVPCGFQRLGLKSCTCQGGSYVACPCSKPDSYLGAPTAPPCSEIPDSGGSNDITVLDPDGVAPQPCEVAWQQCVGVDPEEPDNPNRGCVCLPQQVPATRQFGDPPSLAWICGATNRWFSLEVPD